MGEMMPQFRAGRTLKPQTWLGREGSNLRMAESKSRQGRFLVLRIVFSF